MTGQQGAAAGERGAGTRRRPGLNAVAKVAGVSHQTVSRVINDAPNVAPETRERVLAAIEEIGYRRNAAARALVTSRTHTIGLLVEGEPRYGPTRMMLAVAEAAREAGYFISLAVVQEPADEPVSAALEYFASQAVEGVVVIAPQVDALAASRAGARSTAIPVVVVAAGEEPSHGYRVAAVDQRLGAVLATRHLLELGHRDVVHVSGPLDWVDAVERIEGWREERERWGLPPAEPVVADWTSARGYAVGGELAARSRRAGGGDAMPTAIFAANDQLALGLLRAFGEAGVKVPEDVSVVGFDDIESAAYLSPPLTTVRQPFAAVGLQCLDLLLAEIEHAVSGAATRHPVAPVPPQLVIRDSTAPPRGGALRRVFRR